MHSFSFPLSMALFSSFVIGWATFFAPSVCESTPSPALKKVQHLVDAYGGLAAWLAMTRGTDRLLATNKTTLLQAIHVGMNEFYPGLLSLENVDFRSDVEQFIVLSADAVIALEYQARVLRSVGLPRVYEVDGSIEGEFNRWNLIAQLADETERTQALLDSSQRALERVTRDISGRKPAHLVVLYSGAGFWTIGGRNFYLNKIIRGAGGINSAERLVSYPQVDLEQLIILDPDFIFLNAQPGDDVFPQDLYARQDWQVLRAVRDRHIYKMPRFAVFLGPPEKSLLARWLAEVMHPEIPSDFRVEYRSAYEAGYGLETSDEKIDQAIYLYENNNSTGYRRFSRSGM